MIVFDSPDFEVIYRGGSSEFLLVTFSSLGMFDANGSLANGKLFWGDSLANRFDYTAFGFMAKKRDWFCSPDMPAACEIVAARAAAFTQVVTYGSSMGGYAALRWASAVRASSVVAFAPQFSIDPGTVRDFDRRYEYAFRPDVHVGMDLRAEHVGCESYLLFDPFCANDLGHARLINQTCAFVNEVRLPHCGHECIRVISNGPVADRLLKLSAQNDIIAIRDVARTARKASSVRALEIAKLLADRKPAVASRLLAKFGDRFEIRQRTELADRLRKDAPEAPGVSGSTPDDTLSGQTIDSPQSTGKKITHKGHLLVMGEERRRLIHMHVPKTAGSALRSAFQKHFQGNLRVFPEWDEKKYANINAEDFDFFSGHFGFETAQRLQGDVVTVLRHPVDRFISVYYFWRQLYVENIERSINTELAYRFKLEDFVMLSDQPGLLEELSNRSTFQIASGSSLDHRRQLRLDGQTDDAIFRTAVENLRSFKAVGVQEHMAGFAKRIHEAFDIELNIRQINVTKDRPQMDAIPIGIRKIIQNWVYMDMELYQEALKMT